MKNGVINQSRKPLFVLLIGSKSQQGAVVSLAGQAPQSCSAGRMHCASLLPVRLGFYRWRPKRVGERCQSQFSDLQ